MDAIFNTKVNTDQNQTVPLLQKQKIDQPEETKKEQPILLTLEEKIEISSLLKNFTKENLLLIPTFNKESLTFDWDKQKEFLKQDVTKDQEIEQTNIEDSKVSI